MKQKFTESTNWKYSNAICSWKYAYIIIKPRCIPTSDCASMEKQSTERGLKLYFCASKDFTGAEISIFCGMFDLSAWFSWNVDCLVFEDSTDTSSLRFSWVGVAPAFLQMSISVGCLSFSSLFEPADGDEDFPLFFFWFREIYSLPLRGWFIFSKSPTESNPITGDSSQWGRSSGRCNGCFLRQLFNKYSTCLHHKTTVRHSIIMFSLAIWRHI